MAGRQYPHRQAKTAVNTHKTSDPPAEIRVGFNEADIDAAIADLNETLDVSRADIDTLLRRVEQRALLRMHSELTCADIMSRDVVQVTAEASPAEAKALLLEHDIRTLPVLGSGDRHLLGTVGLRELANGHHSEVLPISEAVTAGPDEAAVSLLPRLTDGVAHAVIVVDEARHVVGVISQTDLLATLGKSLAHNTSPGIMGGAGQGI